MPAPASASRHYRRLQRLKGVVLVSARRAWRRLDPEGNWQEQYRDDVGPKLTALAVAAQIAATRESDAYIADVLNELDFGPETEPGVVPANAFAGWAGDGRPVSTLLEGAVVRAGRSIGRQLEETGGQPDATSLPEVIADALNAGEGWLDMVLETIVADTARAAEQAAIAPREWVEGYVRMLNPPSCSRCVILAGRYYHWNDGFERHPRCDCVHIPAPEADFTDLRVNPDAYFQSLSRAEQDKAFTIAGAEAIRDGADISQVVNARRGMHTAAINQRGWIAKGRLARTEVFGRGVFVTTEGVTKRGTGRKAMGPGRPFRLMPESIYEIADGDRDEAVRLMELYGYITPTPTRSTKAGGGNSGRGGTPPPPPAPDPADEPDPSDKEAFAAYWRARQDALPVDFKGDVLESHEVRFVERFLARGETLEWIPRSPVMAPTNDFVWTSHASLVVEVKSTRARYVTIRRALEKAVVRAKRAGVIKSNFIIDLGLEVLTETLRRDLGGYNEGRDLSSIATLWVLSEDGRKFEEIDLRT